MAYTLNEIRLAAYNHKELPNMLPNEKALWQGLAYCYDWNRYYPDEQAEECKALAEDYIQFYWINGSIREVIHHDSKTMAEPCQTVRQGY